MRSLVKNFASFTASKRANKRSLWLFEIAIAVAIFSICAPFFAIACKSIYQKRLRDLRALQAQHLLSLIWFEVLQSRSLEQRGIVWESFDQKRKIAFPKTPLVFKEGTSAVPYHFSLSFEQSGRRGHHTHKRSICAKLALWNEALVAPVQSERWLTLQRDIE